MGIIRLAIITLLTLGALARAEDVLPALTEDQQTALSFPIDPATPITEDNHYATIIGNLLTWGKLMPQWNAQKELRPDTLPASAFAGVGAATFAEPGQEFIFGGRFIRKEPLDGRPNIERWIVNPYDAETDERGATPVIVYIDRRATGRMREPFSGWYVELATRAYRPTMVESVRGVPLPTQAFIGATYFVAPTPGGDITRYFAWIGIAIACIIALAIVLGISIAVYLRKSKAKEEAAR